MNTTHIPSSHRDAIALLFKGGATLRPEMTDEDVDLLHAAVGISTEAGELLEAVAEYDLLASVISAESCEVDSVGSKVCLVNLQEELGDHLFYEGALRIAASLESLPEPSRISEELWPFAVGPSAAEAHASEKDKLRELVTLVTLHAMIASRVLDVVKRKVMYRKPLDDRKLPGESTLREKLAQHLVDDSWVIRRISELLGFTEDQLREGNLTKLLKGKNARYKDGYTDAAANARADKTETA